MSMQVSFNTLIDFSILAMVLELGGIGVQDVEEVGVFKSKLRLALLTCCNFESALFYQQEIYNSFIITAVKTSYVCIWRIIASVENMVLIYPIT
jgi:hypothetical protein